jgi:cell division protein FtsL
MIRWLTPFALAFAVVSAFTLYSVKYDTRLIDERARQLERLIEAAESDIALLKAEHATLARPERIERLARRHLQLAPLAPAQLGAVGDIPWRAAEGGRTP